MSSKGIKSSMEASVPVEVKARVTEALLGQIINSFDSVLRMVQALCYRASTGDTKGVAELLTAAAWHIDRLISLISDKADVESKTAASYEEILEKAQKLVKDDK